jgi:alpha-mannosidase
VLENDQVLIQVHPDSGALVRLFDKSADRELAPLLPDPKSHHEFKEILGDINVLQVLTEQPHTMAAWNIGSILNIKNLVTGCTVKLVEHGPVRAVIQASHTYKSSRISQDIILYTGSRRIDFKTLIDWEEPGNAIDGIPQLRVSFAPKLADTRATFEIPFGSIVRNADAQEMPALRWVDVSEKGYGLSILNNCKYGHSVEGNSVRLTLLRCSYEPDTRSDIGRHELTYSLYPHDGDAQKALVFRKARELNHPLFAVLARGTQAALPLCLSMLRLEPENMILTTAKATEAGWEKISERTDSARFAITFRAFESSGRRTACAVQIAGKTLEAWELDMREKDERKLKVDKSGAVRFTAAPYEIKTIMVLVERNGRAGPITIGGR